MWRALLLCLAAVDPTSLADQPETTSHFEAADGAKGVRAVFVVRDSADTLAELIWQGEYVRTIFPEVKQRTLAKQESADAVLVDYVAAGPIVDFKYRVRFQRRRTPEGAVEIRWDKVSGDMGIVRGTWTLTPLAPGLCRAEYTSFATLGPSVLDGFVRDGIAKSTQGIAARVRKSAADAAAKRTRAVTTPTE